MDIKEAKKEIQELVDMYGSRHDREDFSIISNFMKKQQAELEKKDKVIKEMAEYIALITESCPFELHDYDMNCEKRCKKDIEAECWKEYFTKKVEGK